MRFTNTQKGDFDQNFDLIPFVLFRYRSIKRAYASMFHIYVLHHIFCHCSYYSFFPFANLSDKDWI